jgi:hypothetical protein
MFGEIFVGNFVENGRKPTEFATKFLEKGISGTGFNESHSWDAAFPQPVNSVDQGLLSNCVAPLFAEPSHLFGDVAFLLRRAMG